MKKKDIIITLDSEGRVYLPDNFAGFSGENLMKNIIFKFKDNFINGTARVDIEQNGNKYSISEILKENETYKMPIKSSLLKTKQFILQLVITEGTDENDIPIFKSNTTYLFVGDSINATSEIPDEYQLWIDIANAKLNEIDNAIDNSKKIGDYAQTQGNYAKEQGNYAKETADSMVNEITEIKNSIPKNTSDLNNDKGFINKLVDDLVNYYTKNETFTKEEINNLVTQIPKFKIEVVQELPNDNISLSSIYLVPSSSDEEDIYKEYIYTNDRWELLGIQKADLSDYYKKNEVDNLLLLKVDKTTLSDYYTSKKIDTLLANKVNLTTLDNYVKNTDYSTNTKAGVIKTGYCFGVATNGVPVCGTIPYSTYQNALDGTFIGKGTLENVLNAKIGSIDTILDSINGEVI